MREDTDRTLIAGLREALHPIDLDGSEDDELVDTLARSRLVLLGEATHGTQEFYWSRARITQRLIAEHGFDAVCVEADWPDAHRVNRFVRGASEDTHAQEALGGFRRFPTWMWRNTAVEAFVAWLRNYNQRVSAVDGAGFYGLDLYSLHASINAVLAYLERVDPQLALAARDRYACFDRFQKDPAHYGAVASRSSLDSCEADVVDVLLDLQRHAVDVRYADGIAAADEAFHAEQNARLVRNAEAYYRTMYAGRIESWNLRDRHMAETLDLLQSHLAGRLGREPRIVVWAHNSHLGDARATQMGRMGELNLGQLVAQAYAGEHVRVGYTTYAGTVTAAEDWDEPPRIRRVQPALPGSYEALFHDVGESAFWVDLRTLGEAAGALSEARLQRAIGVVYKPETERWSHYFDAHLTQQFDLVLHFDHTQAVEPLETGTGWRHVEEPPETYPLGL